MLDVLREYSGILSTFPDIIVVHKVKLLSLFVILRFFQSDWFPTHKISGDTPQFDHIWHPDIITVNKVKLLSLFS